MKQIFVVLVLSLAMSVSGLSEDSKSKASDKRTEPVKGYTKKDGTVVAPHDRTAPNGTQTDNWSTKGNVNPETGKEGTKKPKK